MISNWRHDVRVGCKYRLFGDDDVNDDADFRSKIMPWIHSCEET